MSTAQRVTLILPTGILARLDALAFAEHRSRSNAATLLLAEALERRRATEQLSHDTPQGASLDRH
jgi:metal-responsive CopG/Arc/MetJ family transcriptional regulator